jgi:epoxyqueuosine reductase
MVELGDYLRRFLLESGASLVGFADVGELTVAPGGSYPRAVSIGVAVPPEAIAAALDAGHRWAHPDSGLYAALETYADLAVRILRDAGYAAETAHVTRQADISHKAVATRAGLGFVGKCNLLITKKYGAALRLSSVLTDAQLSVGKPVNESSCGTCDACKQICPVDAPTGAHWHPYADRDEFFDWRSCRDLKRQAEGSTPPKSCGLCMAACPFTQAYLRRHGVAIPSVTKVHPHLKPRE